MTPFFHYILLFIFRHSKAQPYLALTCSKYVKQSLHKSESESVSGELNVMVLARLSSRPIYFCSPICTNGISSGCTNKVALPCKTLPINCIKCVIKPFSTQVWAYYFQVDLWSFTPPTFSLMLSAEELRSMDQDKRRPISWQSFHSP